MRAQVAFPSNGGRILGCRSASCNFIRRRCANETKINRDQLINPFQTAFHALSSLLSLNPAQVGVFFGLFNCVSSVIRSGRFSEVFRRIVYMASVVTRGDR